MAIDPSPFSLLAIYDTLYQRYGPQHWWPAEEPFEVIIGAILTQSTAWANVEQAIANLKRAGVLHPAGLHGLEPAELAALIRPSGYFNQKAKKILAFVQRLTAAHGGDLARLFALDLPALREELLGIYGIGPETADSIILYAAEKPIFVIDAYTVRIFGRLGFAGAEGGYAGLQRMYMDHLPHDVQLFNEYHGLLVRHGKYVCRKRPRCEGCVLATRCAYTAGEGQRDEAPGGDGGRVAGGRRRTPEAQAKMLSSVSGVGRV